MLSVLALVGGVVVGFVGSRALRPKPTAVGSRAARPATAPAWTGTVAREPQADRTQVMPRPAPPQALAVVRPDTGDQLTLGPTPITIGRSRDRQITIADDRVSRAHARIEPADPGWVLVDEGSSNGTRLNGQRLAANDPRPLRAGDTIAIGPLELRIAAIAEGSAS